MNQKRNNDELLTTVFGSKEVLEPAPTDVIPQGMMRPEIAYQIVKDETYPQTQPRLNLATFVTTYMDEYATRLMNEAISVNYIDETEYPRIAVMNGRCINMIANLWNTPEKAQWKAGALGIGSSEACMLGGVAAWLRWRKRRQAAGKPFDKPNLVMSAGFQVVWEKFCQLWQIELRTVPLTLKNPTLDPEQALAMCDENTICIVPIQGVTWTGLNDDVEALDKALDAYNKKTGFEIPIHVDAASGGFILPFLNPEVKWDFRLKWVLSISTSGHKYGLVYPGLGWVVWKDKKYLPDEMSFSVNYLGANITQVGLNFSRPAAQVLGQYYNFLRLGFEGYKEIQQNSMDIATYCHDQIGKMKCFRNYADKLVNTAEGYDIEVEFLYPGMEYVCIVAVRSLEDVEVYKRVTVRMDDWPSEARVESELFDVLPGTWTISYSYLDYNDMPQEIKDVEVKIEAGVDDKTCKEYRARNMLVLTGYPFQGGEPLYYSPADLMRESSWYSAAPELAYRDYGAKIFFHIGEGDEVTVPSSKSVYLYNWGDWPLLFVGMDYDKYQLAPASFPVEVSSDRRTLTIKQYVSGAEFEYGVYRPSVVMDGVKLNVAVSDIVLRKVD